MHGELCPKPTTAIRQEMKKYLDSNKRRRPLFIEEGDVPDVVVVDAVAAPAESVQVEDTAPAESQASKVPSSGTAAKQWRANYLFKATAATNTKPKANKSVVEMLRKTPEEIVDERRKGCSQPTIAVCEPPPAQRRRPRDWPPPPLPASPHGRRPPSPEPHTAGRPMAGAPRAAPTPMPCLQD